ncbi:MAG: ArsA family ATPase [Nocardioides sp.]
MTGTTASGAATPFGLDIDALLDDRATRILVCCGAGGVGKTTTAAALAVRAAERGRCVVVLTIDPARRLAQSMGIGELDNTPRPVRGIRSATGRLDATMLDMKSTFDDLILSQATPAAARQILENPFYLALSGSFAGTQEYMAMEKLGQLHDRAAADGSYDLIVVDTPPSRSALDFLDAPERLSRFLDGRFVRLLITPARGPARFVTSGLAAVTSALTRVIGVQLLSDMRTFVAALDTVFGGFRARAEDTYRLLQADGTAFLVVATPEPEALTEAAHFVSRLRDDRMPLAGVVLNRVGRSPSTVPAAAADAAAAELERGGPGRDSLTSALLRVYADAHRAADRHQAARGEFAAKHPGVAITEVAALPGDVHDLDVLRQVGELLAG